MDRHDRRTVHPSVETPPFADPLPDASAVLPGEREDSSLAPPEIERADERRVPSGTPLPASIPMADPKEPVTDQALHVERSGPSR
jgi:hypothetical protein